MKEPEDLFQQLFYAYQFFLNSSGVAGNRVDVAYLQFAPFFFAFWPNFWDRNDSRKK